MIESLLRMLIASGLVRTRIKQGLASGSLFAGGWVLSHMLDWFNAHMTFLSHADAVAIAGAVSTCVAALVLAVGTAIYNIVVDPNNVTAKVVAAAATGSAAAANDPAVVKEAKTAIAATPGTDAALAALTAKLAEGKI